MKLDGARVIVTGASRGIGKSLALRLAERGSRLVLVARSEEDLAAVARAARDRGGPAVHTVAGDVTDPGTARHAVETAARELGGLDVLVNNAGVGLRAPVARLEPRDLEEVFRVNVVGALNFVRAALPQLKASRGLVVNVSSIAARQPVPFLGGYAATKAALVALGDALRLEAGGVGVLTVLPGSVETDFKAHARGEPYPERAGARRLDPDTVAARIIRAVEDGKREVVVLSRGERAALFLGRLAPRLVERQLVRRYGRPT
ncbi:MAG: SDR family NAD(P)-dependent oxidoreductase [Firmicutes bacterium]|nr:SDR family NAD(P)-dependent oxidoreductase [Bacillota bacterium]